MASLTVVFTEKWTVVCVIVCILIGLSVCVITTPIVYSSIR